MKTTNIAWTQKPAYFSTAKNIWLGIQLYFNWSCMFLIEYLFVYIVSYVKARTLFWITYVIACNHHLHKLFLKRTTTRRTYIYFIFQIPFFYSFFLYIQFYDHQYINSKKTYMLKSLGNGKNKIQAPLKCG